MDATAEGARAGATVGARARRVRQSTRLNARPTARSGERAPGPAVGRDTATVGE